MHSTTLPLDAWIQEFLRAPGGNLGLADGLLLEPRSYFGPFHLPLTELTRCCGPEDGMAYPVSVESFELRVGGLQSFLQAGGEVAPLIVNFTGGNFVLTDGNHRHEALVRVGVPEVLVAVWTTGDADRLAFLERYGAWLSLEEPWRQGLEAGREGVVGALVVRSGQVFAQRRSMTRRTFPGCWDLVGGHLEPGETPRRALVRELAEETGWKLQSLLGLRRVVDWEALDAEGLPHLKRELVVAVTVEGEWDEPQLEEGKVTEGRWFGLGDLEALNENRSTGDAYVYDLMKEELGR